jgi:hypothetical protein
MFSGSSIIVIEFISGIEGADMFNFFFSLITAVGLLGLIPLAIFKLIQRA